jgi:tRNA uridine 5-carboxymethylaminomethyl modification enzyme
VDDRSVENPYQQVIKVVSKTLAPFATDNGIPVFGFGDATTGDWSVFPLYGSKGEYCRDLDEVLRFFGMMQDRRQNIYFNFHRVYNEATPGINLSGPTNFAPLIYRAMEICQHRQDVISLLYFWGL